LLIQSSIQKTFKDFGDVGNAIRYTLVNKLLRALAGTSSNEFHAKNWRPQVLTILDANQIKNLPEKLHLLSLASQLDKGRGFNVVCVVLYSVKYQLDSLQGMNLLKETQQWLTDEMKQEGIFEEFTKGFVSGKSSLSEAIWSAVIHTGLGPVTPNTVMMSWLHQWRSDIKAALDYTSTLKGIINLNKALVIFKGSHTYPRNKDVIHNAFIDIWWIVHDGGLLLLLPYLLTRNKVWERKSTIRLFACTTSSTENPDLLYREVVDHLEKIRIQASVTIVNLSLLDIANHMRHLNKPFDNLQDTNTNLMTVGEVFSQQVYDVPYQLFSHDNKVPDPNSFQESPAPPLEKCRDKLLHTAKLYNKVILQHSFNSNLIFTNMPLLFPDVKQDSPSTDFLEYVDTMCLGIDNIVLIRGTGSEVITTYA